MCSFSGKSNLEGKDLRITATERVKKAGKKIKENEDLNKHSKKDKNFIIFTLIILQASK